MWLFPALPPEVAAITEGELVPVAGSTEDLGVGGVGVVAVVTVVGVATFVAVATPVEARFEALPFMLLVDEGRSFVHISATHCDHGREACNG